MRLCGDMYNYIKDDDKPTFLYPKDVLERTEWNELCVYFMARDGNGTPHSLIDEDWDI